MENVNTYYDVVLTSVMNDDNNNNNNAITNESKMMEDGTTSNSSSSATETYGPIELHPPALSDLPSNDDNNNDRHDDKTVHLTVPSSSSSSSSSSPCLQQKRTTDISFMEQDFASSSSSPTKSRRTLKRSKSCSAATHNKKRVSWDRIQTREYALVVGDHPLCQDGLPVSLGWQYNDDNNSTTTLITNNNNNNTNANSNNSCNTVRERSHSYVFPRRLSYEERRNRLCSVSGLSMEQVKNDEIELVVRTLKESWEEVCIETSTDPTAGGVVGGGGSILPLSFTPEGTTEGNHAVDQHPATTAANVLDPLQDMMIWEEIPGLDCDLTDVSDFEWTESL